MPLLHGCDPGDEQRMEQMGRGARTSADKAEKSIKQYLGGSVYAGKDDYGNLVLTTENGLPHDPSNTIILENEALYSLSKFLEKHYGIKVTS